MILDAMTVWAMDGHIIHCGFINSSLTSSEMFLESIHISSTIASYPTFNRDSDALPDYLRNPTLSIDVFKRYLKTFLFAQY